MGHSYYLGIVTTSTKEELWVGSRGCPHGQSEVLLKKDGEPPLHSWNEAYLVVVNDLFDVLLNSVCHYFIEDFCINDPNIVCTYE
jgi:hypothetical protein